MTNNEARLAIEYGGRLAGVPEKANAIAQRLGYGGSLVFIVHVRKSASTPDEVALAVRDMVLVDSECSEDERAYHHQARREMQIDR